MRRRILSFLCLLGVAVLQSSALAADAPKSRHIRSAHVARGVTGDFDELLKRRGLRILVVPNRTHFFVDRRDARHHVRRVRALRKIPQHKAQDETPLKDRFYSCESR